MHKPVVLVSRITNQVAHPASGILYLSLGNHSTFYLSMRKRLSNYIRIIYYSFRTNNLGDLGTHTLIGGLKQCKLLQELK